jgi:hypothetical protein
MHISTLPRLFLFLTDPNDHLDCGPGPTNFAGEITAEAWVCLSSKDGVVVSHRGSVNDGYVMSVSTRGLRIELANGAEKARLDTPSAPFDDQWHHLAFTLKDKVITAYIDGVPQGTAAFHSPIRLHAQALRFGRDAYSPKPDRGLGTIAEVRIWNKARTAVQIVEAMNYRLDTAVADQTAGLVGYWPLAGSPQDMSVQGHHGFKQGGKWTDDTLLPLFKRDERLAIFGFPGAHYAECATAATRFDALTVEAWVQAPGDCEGSVIQWAGPQDTPKFNLTVSKRDLAATLALNAENQTVVKMPNALDPDRWHHVAFTWSQAAQGITLFIDGVAKSTQPCTATALNITAGAIRLNPGSLHVADVRIWNTARLPNELLATRHTRLLGNEANLIAYWRLDQPGRTIREQAGRLPDATFVGQGVNWAAAPDLPLEEARVENAVLSFNDEKDHVECILNIATVTNALTVEAWVRIQNMSGTVVAQGAFSPGITSYDMSVSPNTLSVEVRGGEQLQRVTASAPVRSLVGSWHHVAFTLFDNIITTYIDGVANEKKLIIDVAHDKMGADLYIGCHSQLRNIFKGEIAEVRIWNIRRTAPQINAARFKRLSGGEAGLVAYFPLAEGTGHVTTERVNALPTPLNGPVWKSDPSLPLAPAADRGHTSLPAATTASTPPPATKNAWLEFDGIDDYLDCGEIDFARGAYTIEAWIKTPQYGTLMAATVNALHGLIFATGRYLHRYPLGTVGGAAINLSDEQIKQITDDQWHHIAIVRTASAFVMMIDGVRKMTLNDHSQGFQEAPRVQVGRRAPSVLQNTFKGGIRNLRFWNIARSDQDIASAMHQRSFGTEPGLVAYWPLDEGAGIQGASSNTLVDRTGRYTATLNGARWVSDGALANGTPVLRPPALVQTNDAPLKADAVLSLTKGRVFSSSSELATENLDPSLKKLINEVEQAKEDDSLKLNAQSFSEFNLFTSLDGILVNTLGIRDFKLTLLGVAQRESGEGAEPAPAHAAVPAHDAAQAQSTPDKRISGEVGLNITGKVDLLGLTAVAITIEFVIRDDKSKATFVKIEGGNVLKDTKSLLAGALPAEVASVLGVLGALMISNPTIAFATEDFDDIVPPYNLGVRPGLNLYGTLKTDQFADPSARTFGKVLKFVAALFGLDALTLRVVLHKSSIGMELGLDSVIEQDITLLKGESFNLTYKGLGVNLSVRGTPPEPSLSIINQLVLTLTYIGAEDLLLTGSFKGETESFTGAYTLQTPEDKPWHPFNFSQLSVGALAVQIGGTYTKPFVDNFGVAAQNITIGKGADAVKGSLAILIDFNDPDQFVLVIETPEITLLQLISCFSLPTLIAYQALPSGITTALNKIVNVKLKGPSEGENAKVSIVPAPTHIGALAYDEEGIHAEGTLSLWGWEATTHISISPETVEMQAELDPIDIRIGGVDIFSLRGAEGNEKPAFRLYLGSEETPEFFMALSVNLLMMRSAVYASLDERGLKITLERSFGPIQTSLSVMADSAGVEASGSTTFSLNLSIPVPGIGFVQLVDVKFVAATTLKAAQSFYLKLDGKFEFYGQSYALSLILDEPVADFSDLLEKVIAQLLKMVGEGLFAAIWKTFESWGQAVVDGVIYGYESVASVSKNVYKLGGDQMQRIIQVSQEIGDGVVTIASGMNLVYGWTETQAAQAFKVAGVAADEVIKALTISYQIPAARIKAALEVAGYAAEEIFAGLSAALVSVNSLTAEGYAGALKAAGYAVEKIAEGLKAAYGLAEKAMTYTLKAAGYVAGEVARGLKAAYALGERAMIDTLKTAWYGVEEITQGLKAAYALGADGVAGLLKGAGYTAVAVANGLQSAYALTADQIVPVLLHAKYFLKDVGSALKDGYTLTAEQAAKVLDKASAVVDLVTGVAKGGSQFVAGKAVLLSSLATSAVVPIAGVLKDVYLCSGEKAAKVLKSAVMYSASGVAQGLKEVYHFTGDVAANALKGAGCVAMETTLALKSVYQFTAVQAAHALKGAGYLVGEVAKGLKDIMYFADGVAASVPLASALKAAGYIVSEVAQGLKDAYSLTSDAAAGALKGAGYTAGQVAQGLKDTYQLTGDAAAVALKGAGYAAKEVGDALHTTYKFSLDQAKNALNGAGYAVSAIGNLLF